MIDWNVINLDVEKQSSMLDILSTVSLNRLCNSLHLIRLNISVDEGLLELIRPFVREVSAADTPRKAFNLIENEFIVEFFERLYEYEPHTARIIYNYIPYDFRLHRGIADDMRTHLFLTKNIVEHFPDTVTSWPLTESKKTVLLELLKHDAHRLSISKQIIRFLNEEPYSLWEEEQCYYFGKYFAPLNWFALQCDFAQTILVWRDITILLEPSDFDAWRKWVESTEIFETTEVPNMSFGEISGLLKTIRI